MDQNLDENTTIKLSFSDYNKHTACHLYDCTLPQGVRVGEYVYLTVIAEKLSSNTESSAQSAPCPMLTLDQWQNRIRNIGVHAGLCPVLSEMPRGVTRNVPSQSYTGNKRLTFVEGLDCQPFSTTVMKNNGDFFKPYSYHIILKIRLNSVPGDCSTVALTLTVWLSGDDQNVQTKKTLTTDGQNKMENTKVATDPLSVGVSVAKIAFTHELKVLPSPTIGMKLLSVAGRHNLHITVSNISDEAVSVVSCQLVPSSSHWTTQQDILRSNKSVKDNILRKESSVDKDVISAVKAVLESHVADCVLQPQEKFACIYSLRVNDTTQLDKVYNHNFAVIVTWTQLQQAIEDASSADRITTTYLLPKLCFRQAPFVVLASVDNDDVITENSFSITYTMLNRLQDFLGLKLYWSPERALSMLPLQSQKERAAIQNVIDNIICHDPTVDLGALPVNSSVSVKVGFHVLHPGVYEMCQHMKLNLRYALPPSPILDTKSHGTSNKLQATPTTHGTISPDDLSYLMAAENLWRDRNILGTNPSTPDGGASNCSISSSSGSLVTLTTKSYSVGDLRPSGLQDSGDEAIAGRPQTKPGITMTHPQSSSVTPPVTLPVTSSLFPPSSVSGHINPNDFVKQSCQIYIPI